jgi:hypothetical protein
MFAMRLLELEQKFESYCTMHEQELMEFRGMLDQFREDLLNYDQVQSIDDPKKPPVTDSSLVSLKNSERKE